MKERKKKKEEEHKTIGLAMRNAGSEVRLLFVNTKFESFLNAFKAGLIICTLDNEVLRVFKHEK